MNLYTARNKVDTPASRALKVLLAAGALLILGLLAFPAPARAQTLIQNNVPYTTLMWSDSDPYGFQTLSNLVASGDATVGPRIAALEGRTNAWNAAAAAVTAGSANWDSAFSWGDHALAGYLARHSGTSTNQTLVGTTVADKLAFNTAFSEALAAGQIAWDPDWQTFRAGLPDGVTGQFFQESQIYAKNASGQIITNGMAVMQSDAVGNSGKIEITLALASVGARSSMTLGVATHDIAAGAFGKITWFGNVNEIDTTGALYGESGWTNNMPVYVSTNKPGFLTKFEPTAPYPRIVAGSVINAHANTGNILVRPTWGMRLADLDDVDGTPLTETGQIPVYDSVRGVFDFDRNVNEFLLASEFGTWTSTNKVTRLSDVAQPARYFTALENGTGTVYEISGPFMNYTVALSSDFKETTNNTRPSWTTNVFPFTDGFWSGYESSGSWLIQEGTTEATWSYTGGLVFPITLTAQINAQGTAVISNEIFYTTNAVRRFATEMELDAAKVQCGTAMTNLVIAATNALMPYTSSVYGDFTTTNEIGYAAFVSANPSVGGAFVLVPASTPATNTCSVSFPITGQRINQARLTGYSRTLSGTTVAKSMLSYHDVSGAMILSNEVDMINGGSGPHFTNTLNLAGIYATNGWLRATYTIGATSGVAKGVYTGSARPMTLSVTRAPTPYATVGDLAAYPTFAQANGIVYSNSVSALTIYTNASGAATSWWQVASGVTNSGTFSQGTPGAITNGMGGMLLATNATGASFVNISGSGGGWGAALQVGGNIYLSNWGAAYIRFPSGGYVTDGVFYGATSEMGFKSWLSGAERWTIRSLNGNAYIDNGSLTVAKTNTAAVVVSQGEVKFGPTIGGKQAHLFSNGTNCFFVNVNSVTNGGETSIIAPLYESGTNVTVTSTQSVYSVAVTGAGPVGIDWSGLGLDGTGRAEITLRINVTEWAGTNVTFAPSLTFDQTPEILVTGVWEFACSTIDGVTTRVRQTWPETGAWTHMMGTCGSAGDQVGTWASFAGGGSTNLAYFNLPNTGLHYVRMRPKTTANGLSGTYWLVPLGWGTAAINLATAVDTNVFGTVSVDYTIALDGVIDGSTGVALVGTHTPSYGVNARYRDCLYRLLNANERAAYAAGWRP